MRRTRQAQGSRDTGFEPDSLRNCAYLVRCFSYISGGAGCPAVQDVDGVAGLRYARRILLGLHHRRRT